MYHEYDRIILINSKIVIPEYDYIIYSLPWFIHLSKSDK